jgi:hypothetical protein
MLMIYFALLYLGLLLVALPNYGIFRDELYYIACSENLSFGYVDHPPLAMFLLKLIRLTLGESLLAIRLLPALAGALFVFMTGIITRELGGKKFSLLLATAAAFAPIGNFVIFHFYSMNFLDLLFWQIIVFCVIRVIKTEDPRYWLIFGLAAGLGLQNKISVLFLGFGLLVGLFLTKERKQLARKEFWIGGLTAGLLFLPYILWNITHGWAHLEFIRNAKAYKMAAVSPLQFLVQQLLYNNPATLLIWLAGLGYFFFHKDGRKYRVFGWMFLSLWILYTLQQAKVYYLAGGYPILFSGGAVLISGWIAKKGWTWLKPLILTAILVPTFIYAPLTLPILPVEKIVSYQRTLGFEPLTNENHDVGPLSQHYADMFGWEKMVATVAEVYRKLTPEEQTKCYIYVRNYGEAGAIDFFGGRYGLPKAACSHNSYWLWGPGESTGEVGIIFGVGHNVQTSLDDLAGHFEEVELGAVFSCAYCMPYENNRPIFICRGMKGSLQEIWAGEKHYN